MTVLSTEYFTEVGSPGTATTLSAPGHTTGGTSISVVSTSNWPTSTAVIFAMDATTLVNGVETRTVGTYTEFEGVVTGATTIASLVIRYGTDQNYTAGSATRVYIPVASSRENRLVEGILVHTDQDGTLKAGAVDVAAVLASNVVETAKIKDANVTNAKLATGAGEPGGAWTAWTPTLANWTVGANAVDAKYSKIGNTVHFRLSWKFGAGAGVGTAPTFTLPVPSISYPGVAQVQLLGTGLAFDSGVGSYGAQVAWLNTTHAIPLVYGVGGAYPQTGNITATVPMTWTTDDELYVQGIYEAA